MPPSGMRPGPRIVTPSLRSLLAVGAAMAQLAVHPVGGQVRHQEVYKATFDRTHLSVIASADPGFQVTASRRPDYVQLSVVLPEAATAWVDSATRILDSAGVAPAKGETVTLSSPLLSDSAHNAVSLDRVFDGGPARCTLFFRDGQNLNRINVDLPCPAAREFTAGVRAAADSTASYARVDSASPAARGIAALRDTARRRDSLHAAAAAGQVVTPHDTGAKAPR
jgi:hypothetical protein